LRPVNSENEPPNKHAFGGDRSAPDTAKHDQLDFHDTETFFRTDSPKKAPPAGSLAAWLAKSQKVAAAPQPSSRPRGNGDLSGNQWWICCDPLLPIPLGDEVSSITIGRASHAGVVLPHTQVSRLHGKIKILGPGHFTYEDNHSANGSRLNGKKTQSATLHAGDVLGIGPYEIEIHSTESLRSRSSTDLNECAEGGHTRVVAPESEAAMMGRLSEVPIREILQGLEFNRKTGTLGIQCPAGPGHLIVCEGHPIQAKFAGQDHDEALIRMAGLTEGRFEFSASVEPGEPMFRSTITAILLESARREDEHP
jgi:hypothetical protein